jgi:preprotein translocase subunit SecF
MSIEFTGGTLMEVRLPAGKTRDDLEKAVATWKKDGETLKDVSIARTRSESYFIRTETLSNEQHLALVAHLKTSIGDYRESQQNTIGPTVGSTLKRRAFWALGVAVIAIVFYIALAFRKIPRKLSPWRFGITAIVALVHDIMITVGVFTILNYFKL